MTMSGTVAGSGSLIGGGKRRVSTLLPSPPLLEVEACRRVHSMPTLGGDVHKLIGLATFLYPLG